MNRLTDANPYTRLWENCIHGYEFSFMNVPEKSPIDNTLIKVILCEIEKILEQQVNKKPLEYHFLRTGLLR